MFRRRKVPVAWRVEGDEEIPIAYDDGRIPKIIDKLLKLIRKIEQNKLKKEKELSKLLDTLREKDIQLVL